MTRFRSNQSIFLAAFDGQIANRGNKHLVSRIEPFPERYLIFDEYLHAFPRSKVEGGRRIDR
jgi:hypothetical protein